MKGLFIPEITAEMFRNGCLEGIEALMAEGEIYDIDYTGWIPVSERLPEEDGWYLVTVQGYETVTDVSLYSADGCAWGDVSTKQKVIAWLPLPKPYREDSKDYELATEQMEHDAMYEPTYNSEDGSM